MQIEYRELTIGETVSNRCGVILENQLQCPERAAYRFLHDEIKSIKEKTLCKHHFAVEIQVGTLSGYEYVRVDSKGEPVEGDNAKLPIAKQGAKQE